MQSDNTINKPETLPAEAVAWRLLEEVNLEAWRSEGKRGLRPTGTSKRSLYTARDVDAFISRLRFAIRPTTA